MAFAATVMDKFWPRKFILPLLVGIGAQLVLASKPLTSGINSTLLQKQPTTAPHTMSVSPAPTEASDEEQERSLKIFFSLLVLVICIFFTRLILKFKFRYLPESVGVVLIGTLAGLIIRISGRQLTKEEQFDPSTFFIVLLPPIIFESGYSLHKGNFFQNLGSILLFAVIGTAISAVIIGGGIYGLGVAGVLYQFTAIESFAFGSLISAVDPVATLAIFHALDVEPTLHMLVFGESVLNDAVSIVMTRTVLALGKDTSGTGAKAVFYAIWQFCAMFVSSAAIGVAFALASALLLKHINLRSAPALEFSTILIFAYMPYGLSEALKLSGIMAILFCGIVMSHYTHFNLSPVTQVNVQQSFRCIAWMAETCVFAYLGMAIFSFTHIFQPALVIWCIVLCLIGRACNIFPLSALTNLFRQVNISRKMQCVMWFSGLRGAIAFALSLTLQEFDKEKRQVLVTTTLVIVLFTILCLGGSTLPLLKFLKAEATVDDRCMLSKTEEQGLALDAEQIEENTPAISMQGFARLDIKYLIPFFRRKFTVEEMQAGRYEMQKLTQQWYAGVTSDAPSDDGGEEEEEEEEETGV